MKVRINIALTILTTVLLAISCKNQASKHGDKYTYSFVTYGTTVQHDTIFEAQNDSAAYLWALEKFHADKMAVCSELDMSDMDVFTAFRTPKVFSLYKSGKRVHFDDMKSPSMIEDESVAYDGAYFGMSLSDVSALPQFAAWTLNVGEDIYTTDGGVKIPVKASTLKSRVKVGDYDYSVSFGFNYADKLAQVTFKSDGANNDIQYKSAEKQFRFLIRKRYGMSKEDVEYGRLDDSKDSYHWNIGDKLIHLFLFPGKQGTEVHANFSSLTYTNAQEKHFKELAEELGNNNAAKLSNDSNKF